MSQSNNGLNSGPITANDLMQKLAKASKVMQKVQGGNFERGNIDESALMVNTESFTESLKPQQQPQQSSPQVDVNKIQNSKLPDAIKRAMIENPIQQMQNISLSETLDMDIVKGAKRLMEQENASFKKPQQQKQQSTQNFSGGNIDMNAISLMIENTVRKVMDEKLNQILTAQTTSSINENLVLKVGDSIFKGKITGVNKSK